MKEDWSDYKKEIDLVYKLIINLLFKEEMTDLLPAYNHDKDHHFMVRVDREYKCVCELCDCGKHKCPRQKVKGEFETSYSNQYKNFSIVPQIYKQNHKYEQRHYNPESLRSNYQQTYIEKQAEIAVPSPSRLEKVGREILKSAPFVGNTSYKDTYLPFKVQPNTEELDYQANGSGTKESESRVRVGPKFEGQTSYKAQYQPIAMQKLDRYKHPQYKKLAPFTGQSSYQVAYQGFKVEPLNEFHYPQPINQNKQVKFQGQSSYSKHYRPFEVKIQPKSTGCQLDSLILPPSNPNAARPHVYYDPTSKQFV